MDGAGSVSIESRAFWKIAASSSVEVLDLMSGWLLSVLQPCPTLGLIRSLRSHCSTLACQVRVYSGRGSGQVQMKMDENRRSEVWAEVSPGRSCDQLDSTTRTTSIDPLHRFRSSGDGDGDRQGDRSSDLDDFRLENTG